MPERGGVQRAVITAGLIGVGVGLLWLGAAIGLGVLLGKGIRHADEEQERRLADQGKQRPPEDPAALLGVVRPRQPEPAA